MDVDILLVWEVLKSCRFVLEMKFIELLIFISFCFIDILISSILKNSRMIFIRLFIFYLKRV